MITALTLLLMLFPGALWDDNQVDVVAVELDTAKQKYRSAVLAAQKRLLDSFVVEEQFVTESVKFSAEEKLKKLETIAAEKTALESHGVPPKSDGPKRAFALYQKELKLLKDSCEKAYNDAAEKYLKSNRLAAKAILDEKAEFFESVGFPSLESEAPGEGVTKQDKGYRDLEAARKAFVGSWAVQWKGYKATWSCAEDGTVRVVSNSGGPTMGVWFFDSRTRSINLHFADHELETFPLPIKPSMRFHSAKEPGLLSATAVKLK